jgi:hypothetical protein
VRLATIQRAASARRSPRKICFHTRSQVLSRHASSQRRRKTRTRLRLRRVLRIRARCERTRCRSTGCPTRLNGPHKAPFL